MSKFDPRELRGAGAVELETLTATAARHRRCVVPTFQLDYCLAKSKGSTATCSSQFAAKTGCLSEYRSALKLACGKEWYAFDKCSVQNWNDPASACKEQHVAFQRCAEDV